MNEKFRQLAAQAKLELFPAPQHGFEVVAGTDTHLANFAELLVKECAEFVQFYYKDHACESIAHDMKKHFGVEQ